MLSKMFKRRTKINHIVVTNFFTKFEIDNVHDYNIKTLEVKVSMIFNLSDKIYEVRFSEITKQVLVGCVYYDIKEVSNLERKLKLRRTYLQI